MTVPIAFLVARKDLAQRMRDRSALVLAFVAPVVIATVMSFAFRSSEQFSMTLVLVDRDGSALGAALHDVLRSPDLQKIVTLRTATTEARAAEMVRSGDAGAGLVVPDGFTESIAGGGVSGAGGSGGSPVGLRVLTGPDTALAGQVTRSIAAGFTAQIDADRLSVATAIAAGSTEELARLVSAATSEQLPIATELRPAGERTLKAVSYYGPAMGIFFVFFSIAFTARGWFAEAREGTLQRMAAAASVRQILVGKSLAVFVYGVASLGSMALVTTLAFDADWGGPLPAAALIVAMTASVVCLTAFVIVVSRTERQAEGIASVVVFGLALLGGNFVFVSTAPPLLRRLSLFTPNGWTLRGFVDLATGPHSLSTIGAPLLGICGFSLAVLAVTAVASRRMVAP